MQESIARSPITLNTTYAVLNKVHMIDEKRDLGVPLSPAEQLIKLTEEAIYPTEQAQKDNMATYRMEAREAQKDLRLTFALERRLKNGEFDDRTGGNREGRSVMEQAIDRSVTNFWLDEHARDDKDYLEYGVENVLKAAQRGFELGTLVQEEGDGYRVGVIEDVFEELFGIEAALPDLCEKIELAQISIDEQVQQMKGAVNEAVAINAPLLLGAGSLNEAFSMVSKARKYGLLTPSTDADLRAQIAGGLVAYSEVVLKDRYDMTQVADMLCKCRRYGFFTGEVDMQVRGRIGVFVQSNAEELITELEGKAQGNLLVVREEARVTLRVLRDIKGVSKRYGLLTPDQIRDIDATISKYTAHYNLGNEDM